MSATPTRADGSATAATAEQDWQALYGRCEETALGIAENLEACEAQLESDRRACIARENVAARAAEAAAEVRIQGAEARVAVLESALEAAEERADREVWEHPGWWVAGGFVSGLVVSAAIVYGSVWAVGQLRPAIPPAE